MDIKEGDWVKVRNDASNYDCMVTEEGQSEALRGRILKVLEVDSRIGVRLAIPKDVRPHLLNRTAWWVHRDALLGSEPPVDRPSTSACRCSLLQGCTCGVMVAEMAAKGMVKDRWSGLWVKQA